MARDEIEVIDITRVVDGQIKHLIPQGPSPEAPPRTCEPSLKQNQRKIDFCVVFTYYIYCSAQYMPVGVLQSGAIEGDEKVQRPASVFSGMQAGIVQ